MYDYELYYKKLVQMAQVLVIAAFVVCCICNTIASKFGYSNIGTGDKDILLPFSLMIFLFYPLLIYLPETHYKIITFGKPKPSNLKQSEEEEEQSFPYAFLITLVCITVCIIIHRLVLFHQVQSEEEALNRRGHHDGEHNIDSDSSQPSRTQRSKNVEYRIQSQVLKYFLSLAIGLQNIVAFFYITDEKDIEIVKNQLIIFTIFSIIINFAYGYINGWSAVSKSLNDKLSIFVNIGLLFGYMLGMIVDNNLILLVLPCFCCGLMIYCSTLVGLPILFSNGENQNQDKFRYGSIFTSLLLTVIYHPFCYLLRV